MTDSNMIKRSVVTKGGNDTNEKIPKQQITYNGKVADSEMLFPYGMHANVKAGISLGVTWSVEGQEDYRVTMAYTPNERPRVEEGEIVYYHPLTLTKQHYKNNGDLDITVTGENGDLNLTIKKDLNITVAGDANITIAGTATVDAPTTNWTGNINLTGNLDITGNLEVSGSSTLGSTVTSGSKNISDTHTHSQPDTGPDATVQGDTGVPV